MLHADYTDQKEQIVIVEFEGKHPRIDPTAFVAENAMIIGDVDVGPRANIWFNCIVRGDTNYIRIGTNCNLQDACVLHVVKGLYPVILEDDVVIGHRVVVHGCHIGKGSLIGIGAIVLDGAEIGEESIIGAGSVVSPKSIIPPRTLAMGAPARVVRSLDMVDIDKIQGITQEYLELMEAYRK
ncbi:MAG: gamma carbonic anhydrase family protein [Deltaproteobacteria bacterium]|jgi:carbonic anhydrase/acetyltransferase-like protein (isoleucine patch superfamily)|nr:gamma carbonic anhydrase family protein [Deltaproteobacteria bacterium]MBP1746151.1 gamma carbonic anhydrase family protein [Deltaproteobacteria bacterium]